MDGKFSERNLGEVLCTCRPRRSREMELNMLFSAYSPNSPTQRLVAACVLAASATGCPAPANPVTSYVLVDATVDGAAETTVPDVGPPVSCPVSATTTTQVLATCALSFDDVLDRCTAYLPGSPERALSLEAEACTDSVLSATNTRIWSNACCPPGWQVACRAFKGTFQIEFLYGLKPAQPSPYFMNMCKGAGGELIYP